MAQVQHLNMRDRGKSLEKPDQEWKTMVKLSFPDNVLYSTSLDDRLAKQSIIGPRLPVLLIRRCLSNDTTHTKSNTTFTLQGLCYRER